MGGHPSSTVCATKSAGKHAVKEHNNASRSTSSKKRVQPAIILLYYTIILYSLPADLVAHTVDEEFPPMGRQLPT